MHKFSRAIPFPHSNPLITALAAFTFLLILATWHVVHAQSVAHAPMSNEAAAHRHGEGLAMERHGDEQGAFVAFHEAAEDGYPPAQRRLGEIYDSGNSAVVRNYAESIRWYEKAREGGEIIPKPVSPYPAVGTIPAIIMGH